MASVAIAAICLGLLMIAMAFYNIGGTLQGQRNNAIQIHEGGTLTYLVVHPGMYWLTSFFANIAHTNIDRAISIVCSVHFAATYALLVWLLYLLTTGLRTGPLLLCAILLLFMSGAGLPFMPLKTYDAHNSNRTAALLRNVTHIGMVPYMYAFLGCFSLILTKLLKPAQSIPKHLYIGAAMLLAISSLMKPSFSISFIPAIGLYLFQAKILWKSRYLLLALCPSVIIIISEYIMGQNGAIGGGPTMTFTLDPFSVWNTNNRSIPIAFITANALALYMLAFRFNKLPPLTSIAWLNWVIALIPYIALRETNFGSDRNFEWSYLHAKMFLIVCSAADLINWIQASQNVPIKLKYIQKKQWVGVFLLALHGGNGLWNFFFTLWHQGARGLIPAS